MSGQEPTQFDIDDAQARIYAAGQEIKPTMSIPMTDEDIAGRRADIENEAAEIADWWTKRTQATIDQTVPKAVQYGAADLEIMGAAMQALLPIDGADADEKAMMGRYAAVSFYMLGKVARIFGALEQGKLPNPDSEFDLEVYAVMAARIRETGRWV